jgi:alkaline phosphatase D
VRQHNSDEIYSIVDYRNRYALYKSDPDLIAAHRSAPFIVTWDDHEVENNYAGDFDENGTPPQIFLLRRAAAYQAYYEHMPLRMAAWPTGPHMRVYRRLHFGNLIDLSVLDTRQWRSDQACGDGVRNCPASLDPARTMLGAEQEKWLFDNLASVRARWTVLGQQVYSFARDFVKVDPNARFGMDVWDGYPAARTRLYSRLKETRAPNPIVLSGDVHVHFGADLRLDFTDTRSEPIGVEFTNTSISASGDGADVSANWEQIRSANPHIRYHAARRGYVACTATPTQMRADFKILDRVTVPDVPARVGGSLVVEAGRAGSNTA